MSSRKDDNDDLIGFRDFIDQVKKPVSAREKRQVSHEMQTFLEHENTRLQKLVHLYEEKSFILKEHDQYNLLRQKASAKLHQLRKKTIEQLKTDGKNFKRNLEHVLGSHFKD